MKLLRTIRFDASDERVFDHAAEPGEWAVSGAFAFADLPAGALIGKARQGFANGYLGVISFGRSTFVTVSEATPEDAEAIAYRLARHFVATHGAPSVEAALTAAEEEVAFARELAGDLPINTVLTIRRTRNPDGSLREEVRTIKAPTGETPHARIWKADGDAT